MKWTPAATNPTRPGWYVVREYLSDRPLVLWWSAASVDWRAGARRINAVEWLELPP